MPNEIYLATVTIRDTDGLISIRHKIRTVWL